MYVGISLAADEELPRHSRGYFPYVIFLRACLDRHKHTKMRLRVLHLYNLVSISEVDLFFPITNYR